MRISETNSGNMRESIRLCLFDVNIGGMVCINTYIFCLREDKEAIRYGISIIKDDILSNSTFYNGTVIQICSLQYNLCYYQKEAVSVAMMNWCSEVFGFKCKEIDSSFNKENNKYIFDF